MRESSAKLAGDNHARGARQHPLGSKEGEYGEMKVEVLFKSHRYEEFDSSTQTCPEPYRGKG